MTAVRDGNRRRIGLHGMGGIGKTMLAEEIEKLAKEEQLFSKVVITKISQKPKIKKIQQHIAEMLDMTTFSQNKSTEKRAQLLRTRLEQDESKILLILDDIWKELNLKEIGIHDGCKILVTSRDRQVLRNSMGMAESDVFFIGALESSEAIDLFKKIIGDTKVEDNADYEALALKIVKECAGLPIAIATVAHALKCYTDDSSMWEDALQRLRSSNFTGIEGMHELVYEKSIKLSYDFLGSQEVEAKLLLLLCALHEEDEEIQVEDLIRYFVGWRSLQGIYRVEDARNRVNSLVVKLKSRCLLLDCRDKGRVKMHDVTRDVCINIGKEDHGHRMMSNIVMYEDERPKASKAISFADYDDFDNLPPELECPSLELLLLSSGSIFESIPDKFFKQTGLLKVLITNGTRQRSLPSSFASLQNLQTLCLRGSNYLKDMTVIGELKNLKALDLSMSSSIRRLPKELGELRRLQVLDLRGCDNLRVIEANVISKLTQMEELYLPCEFKGWDQIIDEEGGIRNASLIEIKSMQRLTALHLYVPPEHVLPEGLFSEKLERYHISIGVEYSSLSRDEVSSKWLGLSLSQLDQVYARELVSLMRRSECLSLVGSMSVNNVSPSLVNEGFPRLKHMEFDNNDGIQCIINSTHVAFPCLESLKLEHLRSLQSIICHANKLPRGSFNELRKVDVKHCNRLKNLFPLCVAKLLHEITVENCEMMEEIIVREDGDEVGHNIDDDHSSLQLRSLHLESLPKLVQFYCSNHRAAEESDHPKPFFSETVCFPKLENLTMKKMEIEMLWPEQLMLSSTSSFYMQNLTSLKVGSCHNLKYLFSSSVAQKFVNLKSIKVRFCKAMKDIIRVVDQPGEEETTHNDHDHQMEMIDLFPKLESVKLVGLSSLQTFCTATNSSLCMVFPLLSKLDIRNYLTMKAQATLSTQGPFFDKKVCFPNLEDLIMIKVMNIEKLWPDQLMVSSSSSSSYMQNLTTLEVEECNNLKYLFSSSVAQKFVNLQSIRVKDCEGMEDIIRVVDEAGGEKESTPHDHMKRIYLFPKLETLKLGGLSSLQKFCSATESSPCMVFPLLSKLNISNWSTMEEQATAVSTQGPFFDKKVCFPKLEELSMWNMSIEKLLPDQLVVSSSPSSYMQNLTTLKVEMCHNLKYLFSSSVAQKFVNLKSIKVEYCKGMEDIIRVVDQPGEEESTHDHDQIERIDLLPKLQSVKLVRLSSLQIFCTATNSSLCMVFPLLSELDIINCSTMKAQATLSTQEPFFNKKVSFPKLKALTMMGTDIEKLWPDQLMVSSSSSSSYMQNLTILKLDRCDNLKYLFSSSVAQKFVNLKIIKVEDCEAMEDIIRVVDQPGEEETTHHDHDHMEMIDLFPKLESVELDGLSSLQRFCSAEKTSFPNLKVLRVWNCNKMKSLLSSAMARNLVQLERLSIYGCEKIEEVIVSDEEYSSSSSSGGSNINAIIPFQKLDYLVLNDLPNLIRFCELGDYRIECPLLSEMIVLDCPKLKEFMGDKRTSSSCTINTTDNNIIGEEMDRMVSAPNKQILFKHNNKVIVPMLKTLKTDWSEGIKEIFEMSSNSIVLFPNLDTLHLICTSSDEPIGVPNLKLFLHKYHTIRTLILRGSFVNLSNNNGDGEVINNTTTTHLTSPSTPSSSSSSSLEELHIVGADDMVDHVFGVEPSSHNNTIILLFPNLKSVNVSGYRRLQSFAPSFMCFPNLEALTVSRCHGLRYLLSSSTATTLVRLQRMEISYCNEMKEIIINHNGNEEQEKEENPRIVFQNLKELRLSDLPSLQSFFYSGNKVTMSIPNLEQLSIWSCPEMRRFSDGIVDPSASLLKTIKVDGERIDVERDDVNATLAKLFSEDDNKNNNFDWDYDNNNLAHQKDNNDEHCQGQG